MEILGKLNSVKMSKWSLWEHLKPETGNSFQHVLFPPTSIGSFSNFHLVKLFSSFSISTANTLFQTRIICYSDHSSSLLTQIPTKFSQSLTSSGTKMTFGLAFRCSKSKLLITTGKGWIMWFLLISPILTHTPLMLALGPQQRWLSFSSSNTPSFPLLEGSSQGFFPLPGVFFFINTLKSKT